MGNNPTAIVWFRQDLRLSDNPALFRACEDGHSIVPVYILDDDNADSWAMGGASRWWLHHSLKSLNNDLSGKLMIRRGDAKSILPQLVRETGAEAVYWNRCYEPWRIERDKDIKADLKNQDIDVNTYNGSLLFEPWTTLKSDDTPYRVFTPFYKNCLSKGDPAEPLLPPASISFTKTKGCDTTLDDLALLPDIRWDKKMEEHWNIGEKGAHAVLERFFDEALHRYKEGRDRPDRNHTSRLSPHLHFGEISPRQIWYMTGDRSGGEAFLRQLVWREFSYSLLYYFPTFPQKPYQDKFKAFPWYDDQDHLHRWQRGQTGYPIVDAGMRELWETGYMHNRVRMIAASFLIKHLMIPWQEGEKWFWDTLVDADLANNSVSWQWVAGSGVDASPYFRIFNPITQGQKFDPDGDYVRHWIPELKGLPTKYLHAPWEASDDTLKKADITLGKEYPAPIVNHKQARERALEAFKSL